MESRMRPDSWRKSMRNTNCFWNGRPLESDRDGQDTGRGIFSKAARLAFVASCLLSPLRAEALAGALDMNFAPRIASPADTVGAVVLQPDGKLLVSGLFGIVGTTLLGPDITHIVRLNVDGTLDPSFNAATAGTPILQADGNVLLNSQSWVRRLASDGSIDPGLFLQAYINTNTFYGIYTVVSQPDGKIILGGDFLGINGQARRYLARASRDGTLDVSFNTDIGPDLGLAVYVTVAAPQPDGRILVGGKFATADGADRHQLARLNSDGSLDPSFNPKGGPNAPPSIVLVLPDGKILIAGAFSIFDGVGRAGLARLNGDGTLDTSFDPGSGIGGDYVTPDTVAVQPDGKVLVGGRFTSFNGTTGISGIVRLNPDGSVDNTFDIGSGAA